VWDRLKIYAPMPEFGAWPTAILADAYGGDEAHEINARTGCVGCPLSSTRRWRRLSPCRSGRTLRPLLKLKPLYRWMRAAARRLRKSLSRG
jgi:DNA sulfur modification protein DndC